MNRLMGILLGVAVMLLGMGNFVTSWRVDDVVYVYKVQLRQLFSERHDA